MFPNDRVKAIEFLRSIAIVALECAETLEGTRLLKGHENFTEMLAETCSLIEGDVDKIKALKLWTEVQ